MSTDESGGVIIGIDVSKWQKEMDWPKAKQAGAKFAFIRAGSINMNTGVCYKDYQLDRNADLAPEQMNDNIGFYFYFRPRYDPVKQADYFYSLVRDYKWGALVVDCESAGALYATVRKNTERMAHEIGQICAHKPAIIYTRASYWNSVLGDQSWAMLYDLWIARYNSHINHPWGDGNCKPLGWDDFVFWQYSADGNGMGSTYGGQSASMDLNRFNGTETELCQYFGTEEPSSYNVQIRVPKSADVINVSILRSL